MPMPLSHKVRAITSCDPNVLSIELTHGS
jgi:hypothetical protein